jgi:hypothetical protein
MNEKIGRNDPCPCGSGLKYKKCHGMKKSQFKSETVDQKLFEGLPQHVQQEIIQRELKDKKRKAQFGEVRDTISLDADGGKFVAVGNQVHFSKKWMTFHDFLFDYIKKCVGVKWGKAETKKDYNARHPILQWYKLLCDFQRKHIKKEGEVYGAVCTGAVGAYLALAYDLYVLRHHSLLQERLIRRLKDTKQFQGARYEVFVTASFIKAGFDINFEDETDRSSSHCEFVATHKKSGKLYSVEAKSRHRPGYLGQGGDTRKHDEIRLRIGKLLRSALMKDALHTRIIFIDINMPPKEGGSTEKSWMKGLMSEVNKVESDIINGKQCPPAYICFTNHPYHYVGDEETEPEKNFYMTAVNMPHFKINAPDLAKAQDPPIFMLWDSINIHTQVPKDFNE